MSDDCAFCRDAGPDFDYCEVCGRGGREAPPAVPMTGLRLAVRLAKGSPLSTDGPREHDAFYEAVRQREER